MTPPIATDPLPPTIQRALDQIADELGNMPRECVRDPSALCLWKGRLARRVRSLKAMRVPAKVLRVAVPVAVERPAKRRARGVTPIRAAQLEIGL